MAPNLVDPIVVDPNILNGNLLHFIAVVQSGTEQVSNRDRWDVYMQCSCP